MKLYIGDYCPDDPNFKRVVTAEDVIRLWDERDAARHDFGAAGELITILRAEVERLRADAARLEFSLMNYERSCERPDVAWWDQAWTATMRTPGITVETWDQVWLVEARAAIDAAMKEGV